VSVAATIAQLEGLKTFPAVATKVLQLLDEAEFSMNQVSAAIHEDPSLAAAVLRLANSSLYAGDNPVADLRTALVRLGADAVAEAVAAVATMGLFPPRSALAREIRNHCAGTGALFRHLALDFMPQRGSGTFLAGLLHDVGKMLLIDSAEFDYSGANGAAALRFDGIWMEERRLLAYDHAILGGQVLKRWNIPQPIPRLVAMHHQPGRAASFSDIGSLVALLRVADRLEHELRERPEDYEEIVGPLAESADFTETGVTEQWLAENWVRLYQIRADAFSLFRT
jgi:HD-like signal output (HDOD) protein